MQGPRLRKGVSRGEEGAHRCPHACKGWNRGVSVCVESIVHQPLWLLRILIQTRTRKRSNLKGPEIASFWPSLILRPLRTEWLVQSFTVNWKQSRFRTDDPHISSLPSTRFPSCCRSPKAILYPLPPPGGRIWQTPELFIRSREEAVLPFHGSRALESYIIFRTRDRNVHTCASENRHLFSPH